MRKKIQKTNNELLNFGQWLSAKRREWSLTMDALSKNTGVSRSTILNLENGKATGLSKSIKNTLERYFNEDEMKPEVEELELFIEWMRSSREKQQLTQAELAERAGVSLSTVQGLETGRSRSITPRTKEKIRNGLLATPIAKSTLISVNGTGIEHFRPIMMRLAALVDECDFCDRITQIEKSMRIPRLLAIVYLFEEELKK